LETLPLGLRGYRLEVGGSPPPRHQLLHGIHDRILVEETAGTRIEGRPRLTLINRDRLSSVAWPGP
jgi:hypothetical protein